MLSSNNDIEGIGLDRLTCKELQCNFLHCSSWHHTSKYYNVTYFYRLDENINDYLTKEAVDDIIASRAPRRKCSDSEKKERKRNQEALEMAKYICEMIELIYKSGITGLKTIGGVYSRWASGKLDCAKMYGEIVDKVRKEDESKVKQWEKLPEERWRRESAKEFREDIDLYIRHKYSIKCNVRSKMTQDIKKKLLWDRVV